jgi:hypothetical protein
MPRPAKSGSVPPGAPGQTLTEPEALLSLIAHVSRMCDDALGTSQRRSILFDLIAEDISEAAGISQAEVDRLLDIWAAR